jgi:hypothetical protein
MQNGSAPLRSASLPGGRLGRQQPLLKPEEFRSMAAFIFQCENKYRDGTIYR